MQYLLLCSQCGEADSYFSNLLNFFPTVDHLRRYLIYALLLSDEAMTIQHTGNKNTKPLNVSPNLTTGLPSTDIARYSTVLLSTLLICAYSHLSWF
ncbi:hypothetical protein Bca101_093421 [Brassica carinata]